MGNCRILSFLVSYKIKEPTHLPIGKLQVNENLHFPFTINLGILYHFLVLLASVVGKKASFFMAHKRMMMKDVTSKNMFVTMSKGAQLLYFHLNMETDDDGVAEGQLVMNMIRARRSDMIELIENEYVTVIDERGWIVYINDFHAFNSLGKYLVYPSVYRNALIERIPGIKNVLFTPKNNILSRRKGARSKETIIDVTIEEPKRIESTQFKINQEVEEPDPDELPFK